MMWSGGAIAHSGIRDRVDLAKLGGISSSLSTRARCTSGWRFRVLTSLLALHISQTATLSNGTRSSAQFHWIASAQCALASNQKSDAPLAHCCIALVISLVSVAGAAFQRNYQVC